MLTFNLSFTIISEINFYLWTPTLKIKMVKIIITLNKLIYLFIILVNQLSINITYTILLIEKNIFQL